MVWVPSSQYYWMAVSSSTVLNFNIEFKKHGAILETVFISFAGFLHTLLCSEFPGSVTLLNVSCTLKLDSSFWDSWERQFSCLLLLLSTYFLIPCFLVSVTLVSGSFLTTTAKDEVRDFKIGILWCTDAFCQSLAMRKVFLMCSSVSRVDRLWFEEYSLGLKTRACFINRLQQNSVHW